MPSIVDKENFTFYGSWTPRMTPRSCSTHAPGSGLISTEWTKSKISKFYQKTAVHYKCLVVLIYRKHKEKETKKIASAGSTFLNYYDEACIDNNSHNTAQRFFTKL